MTRIALLQMTTGIDPGANAAALDVERGVVVAAAVAADLVFQQVEQAVEAHGGAAVGGEIETVHRNKSSIEQFDGRSPHRRRSRRNALAARCDAW